MLLSDPPPLDSQIHLISDEIYALSVDAAPHSSDVYVSAYAVACGELPQLGGEHRSAGQTLPSPLTPLAYPLFRLVELPAALPFVHTLWGAAKDFGLSGLRFGVLHTCNQKLREAIHAIGYAYACPLGGFLSMCARCGHLKPICFYFVG